MPKKKSKTEKGQKQESFFIDAKGKRWILEFTDLPGYPLITSREQEIFRLRKIISFVAKYTLGMPRKLRQKVLDEAHRINLGG